MNQKSFYEKQIARAWVKATRFLVVRIAALILCFVLCVASQVVVQGQIIPPPPPTNSNGQWTPPDSTTAKSYKPTYENQPEQSAEIISFPTTPVPFDPAVGPASNVVESFDPEPEADIESNGAAGASTLSKLTQSIGAKTTGWLATTQQNGSWIERIRSLIGSSESGKMLGSLALVLGLYFAFVWVMRKINPGENGGLPPEVVNVMGQVPFGPRRNLQLVRLGSKLLLLMNSPEGTQPLGEITDPTEVEHLASLCPSQSRSKESSPVINRASNRQTDSTTQSNSPSPTNSSPDPTTTNLNQIIRMLENAARQGGAVFEA